MLHQSLSSPASRKRFTNLLLPQHVGPAIRAGKGCPFSDPCAQLTISTACTRVYRKKLFWVQLLCHTHESHWYFVVQQIEANIFFLSPVTRVLELNDLLIQLKIQTRNLESDNVYILVSSCFPSERLVKTELNCLKHTIYRADRAERAERASFQPCVFSPGRAWRSRV